MDDLADRRNQAHRAPDLASIVLADRPARRHASIPDTELAAVALARPGYDARSALVLALVVAALAGVIGWSTTIGREQATRPAGDATVQQSSEREAATTSAVEATPSTVVASKPAAPVGIDLEPGRITALRSGAGGGIVRIGIANRGTVALDAGRDAQVLVLLDGEPVGERSLGAIDATGSATTELALESCPSGRHSLVVVIDPRGMVLEADERDNARSQSVSFGC